jgi:hypothetical protein
MAIYLDANVLRGTVAGPELSSVRALAKAHGQAILVPSVALDEATANRRREAESVFQEITSALEKARGLFNPPALNLPDAAKLAADWRKDVARAFRVLNVSGSHAKDALTREIDRIPPTREGRGSRDAAIWIAIRDDHKAKNEIGYFVSANSKDFAQPGERALHNALRAELTDHKQPLHLILSTAALLESLAPSKGREIPFHTLFEAEGVQMEVRSTLWRDIGLLPMNDLVASAFGRPLQWTGVGTLIEEATLASVLEQRAYELPDKRQVVVIQSLWTVWLTFRLSGPKDLIDAGFDEATTAIQVPAQIWATTDPKGGDIEWEVAGLGRAQISPALELLRKAVTVTEHHRKKSAKPRVNGAR